MNNRGESFNLIFTAIILILGIYFGIGALGMMSKAQMQNCAVNATGGIENCSLSNNAYWAMNATDTSTTQTFQLMSWLPILLVVGGFIIGFKIVFIR